MNLSELQADQLYTWSDNRATQIAEAALVRFAKAPTTAVAPVAPTRAFAARLAHRALQTLRQAGMQMRPRSRSWPQVLPLRELFRPQAANGLRAPGVSRPDHRMSGPSPSGPRDLGGDLRDQSRTAASPRGALRDRHAQPTSLLILRSDGHTNGWLVARQYARRLAAEQFRMLSNCGDR